MMTTMRQLPRVVWNQDTAVCDMTNDIIQCLRFGKIAMTTIMTYNKDAPIGVMRRKKIIMIRNNEVGFHHQVTIKQITLKTIT